VRSDATGGPVRFNDHQAGIFWGAVVGVLVFGIFFLVKMAALQNAMLNNIYPPGLEG
jgi:hypothetical protein